MKNLLYIVLLLLFCEIGFAQSDSLRINDLENRLELLVVNNPGLSENYTTQISTTDITLPNLLRAISEIHKLNINVSADLGNIKVINNFPKVTVFDLLLFLCKEYNLDIEFTGDIISFKTYIPPQKQTTQDNEVPNTFLASIEQ